MRSSPPVRLRRFRWRTLGVAVAGFLVLVTLCLAILIVRPSALRPTTQRSIRDHAPWLFGRSDARFTILEYADLECPYCRAYFPVLERWIKDHPQANWEWWNLPLAMHDPEASREAQLAECVGEVDGNRAFWRAVEWIYRHTRGDGAGINPSTRMPGESPAIRACLETGKAEKIVRTQAIGASRQHIAGTPTLRIIDHKTGRAVELQGPVGDDSLLSAIDWLAAQSPRRLRTATSR